MNILFKSISSKNLRLSSFICAVYFLVLTAKAQIPLSNSISDKFNAYNKDRLTEKIFVHTDRSVYVAGEILWFKLYVVEGTLHKPLDLSKVVYVEIFDKDSIAVLQAKVALKNGKGSGSFYLPLTMVSGNFKLRAYTNFMKNVGADYYFEKDLSVINTIAGLNLKGNSSTKPYDVQFFPEGGNYVNGIKSKVAFRAVDKNGQGVDFNGVIVDQDMNTVASIKPTKFGIGNFNFTPLQEKQYRAIIKTATNEQFIYSLTKILQQGYVMSVCDTLEDKIVVSLRMLPIINDLKLNLLIHTRGQIKVNETLKLQNGKATILIDKAILGNGISHFTIFNTNNEPVCERLYFKYPSKHFALQSKTDQQSYTSRKRVSVDISASSINGKSVPANLSLSVYKLDSLKDNNNLSIETYLLLNADLVGTIEHPEYYFNNPNISDIDNLMLTHGWRRFIWSDVKDGKLPSLEFVPEFEGNVMHGLVTIQNGKPIENVSTYISMPSKNFQFVSTTSNNVGEIKFVLSECYGTNNIVVQTNPLKDSIYTISIEDPFDKRNFTGGFKEFNLSQNFETQIKSRSISMQVQNAYKKESIDNRTIIKVDSSSFYGTPNKRYLLDDYTRFPTMEEVMREYVLEVLIRKRQGKFHYVVVDVENKNTFSGDPLILLDGVPYFDADKIIMIDPLKIKEIDVISKRYVLGDKTFDGIVSYKTYSGDLSGVPFQQHAKMFEVAGLQWSREFYSPAYDSQKDYSRIPDFRSLLYWSPDINTDKNGNAKISFYTSDEKGDYIGDLQGIDDYGNPLHTTFYFEVKN